DRLLEARPGLRGRVVFVAMCSPSRQGIAGYRAYAEAVARAADAVNDRWASGDWLPVVLDVRDDYARSLAGLERYDVLVVNPLRDGLNLVAKEGPAINRRDGVLCLSPGAGAFAELAPAAFPMHPFDIEQSAATLDAALAAPFDERSARATHLRTLATARTPADWLADLVGQAGE
ncbi:MAG: trehalose-6-phosphate synthase, partial [Actinomycetota bacterium]